MIGWCWNVFDHTEGQAEIGDRDELCSSHGQWIYVVPRGLGSNSAVGYVDLSHGLCFFPVHHVRRFVGATALLQAATLDGS